MSERMQLQPQKLAALLKNLDDLYVQLESHARIGLTLFERDDMDAFDDNWDKRDAIFGKITALVQKLQPAFSDWENVSSLLTPEASVRCGEHLEHIRQLANNAQEFDKRLRPLLENAKLDLRDAIQKIDNGKKLIKAYSGRQFQTKPPAGISKNG